MCEPLLLLENLPEEQQAIRAKCFHPSGSFVEFGRDEIEQSIPERFEKIVRNYPERIAVKEGGRIMTYAELNATANRLAQAILARQGNKAEPIGLLFEKSAALMAAMLGVLKAGKFFILLDSSFPKARNVDLLEDSQADLVIANRENVLMAQDMVTGPRRVLEFESIDLSISGDDLDLQILSGAFATILYTSGSTGKPKGILCDHRDLLHRVMLRSKENQACEHDRIALLPTGTANAVTNSLFALLNGATLCPFDTQKEGVIRLANWLSKERITICPFSASLFRSFAAALTGKEIFPDLRIIRLRSETVYKGDIALYKKCFPANCTFVTGLSTSETGQLTTYLLNDNIDITGDGVPVGYPVEDKEIFLLDDAGNEVGVNQVGEIVVRSRYLAIGYWRRPELTEAKFRADPECDGRRFCFTGDLGLRLLDGCLVHKGRKDFRVKIRGYAVELAEVEQRLFGHGSIKEAVVVARQTDSGDAHLVAYFTVHSHSTSSAGELRKFLEKKLPRYMIPSAFVLLEVMPLTPNGKIDRSALPLPENRRRDVDSVYMPPRTHNEEKLVKILAGLLDIDQIGTDDNFFDLGGHSLLAGRLISRIRDVFQVEIPLTTFLETPTIAALGKVIEQADPDNRGAKDLSIRPAARTEALPLSFSQQRLWFLDQLFPQSFAYNMLSAYKLTGKLNVPILAKSINEIIRRHEVWRTVFTAVDGEPRQVVLSHLLLDLPLVDLRETVSDVDRDAEVSRRFKTEAQAPFDLARGSLVRVLLLRLREDEYVLLLTKHHIVYDGWSRGIIARELTALYEAFLNSQPSPLIDLPMQYADYAVWQRHWYPGEVLEEQVSFWKKQLEKFQPLQLPTDRPRPSVQTNRGARRYFALSATLSAALKELSREHDVTLFITLLAAFKTLLHRYTGQTDILVGSPVAGRNRSELENLIGFFLNMLPLRTDLSGNPTFRHVLARVREVCFGAYSHQDLPFEKLIEEMRPERSLSRNPVFQVIFTLQNTPRLSLELAGLRTEELEIFTGITRFDLELFMEERDNELQGYLNYSTDLFDESKIIRMLGHFETLLTEIVTDPDQRIFEFPLLTEAERQKILVEWNDTATEYPQNNCIHQLFESQVERTPDAVAVVFEDKVLTYRELNSRANQLGHCLRKHGVKPEVLVGICVERSVEMVVGILGVLKAGGAYVPLDPECPKERLAFQLEDTKAPVILTQERLLGDLPEHDGRVICLDRDWAEIARESEANPESGETAENLAYVIYTSGSTGQPNGAMNTHRGICNRLLWMQEAYKLTEEDRVLQKTPFSFDVSVWEFFWPLLTGARLVVAQPGGHRDSAYLVNLIADQQITTLHFVPSMLQVFLEDLGVETCISLKRVICSGEALPTALQERFFARLGAELYNLYGPTEAAVDVTFWACERDSSRQTVPIGRPIANTQIYILDAHLEPIPIGVPGELCIGGVGVARGYLNRPELTAEKFIRDPFRSEPDARLYKTGDLARYLPDGNIEFLGRVDHQVKIRGFRVELGEIEAVLCQHPAIREAIATVLEDNRRDTRLVGYVVARSEESFDASEVRKYLKQKLPEYMIPSALVLLDELPLTLNGKVDRNALPAPDQDRPQLEDVYQPPRTRGEETLVAIWGEVLKLDKIGIHDNFFELGGHSLLATQIISRIRNSFSIELPLRHMFESPTVAAMAVVITEHRGKKLGEKKLNRILTELESLSDEDAQRLLVGEKTKGN